jgi:ribonuclease G
VSEEILINVTPQETRVAVVENWVLQEVVIERSSHRGLVGNIYQGRVCRVLPGMQAAFVEIGLEKAGFLHLPGEVKNLMDLPTHQAHEVTLTYQSLHQGQTLLVQVTKEPLGNKGARLTTQISIPARYVVLLPHSPNLIGVSSRITSEAERTRLKTIALQYLGLAEPAAMKQPTEQMVALATDSPIIHPGFIIRTAAEGVAENLLRADMAFLTHLWQDIKQRAMYAKAGTLIYQDLPLTLRTMRDLIGTAVERIRIDSPPHYQQLIEFSNKFSKNLRPYLEYYRGERPIFELYSIDEAINQALERKVLLKSGGYLVIDQTEAMTTIDVNTGAFVGSRNLEETIFKTNLEAAQAIARQLRLRNLGGIIILDFIDMEEPAHKEQVLQTLAKYLQRDRSKTHISEVSALGLVQMTRKRTRESLEHTLCETCPTCKGRGSIKTVETIVYEIFRALLREAKFFETKAFLVLAAQPVIERILTEESDHLAELAEFTGCDIRFQVENSYGQEQYDIIPGLFSV